MHVISTVAIKNFAHLQKLQIGCTLNFVFSRNKFKAARQLNLFNEYRNVGHILGHPVGYKMNAQKHHDIDIFGALHLIASFLFKISLFYPLIDA